MYDLRILLFCKGDAQISKSLRNYLTHSIYILTPVPIYIVNQSATCYRGRLNGCASVLNTHSSRLINSGSLNVR